MRATLWFLLTASALAQTAGDDKSATSRALEAGARLLQGNAPAAALDVHLSGFHPLKDEPGQQMHAHHFCRQLNEDLMQCALFDGSGADARLTGLEYVVSERLFASLPAGERRYWHPHNGEILSGQLVAPGLPAAAEKAFLARKLGSYGKTFHTWDAGDALPLGPPRLAWSFNRDGELRPELLQERDRRLGTDTAARRRDRASLVPQARPQWGVDTLAPAFPAATPIPGVRDAR